MKSYRCTKPSTMARGMMLALTATSSCSGVMYPLSSRKSTSRPMPRSSRLTQNPGMNFSMTVGTWPTCLIRATTASTVSSRVSGPRTTSTRGMMCGGANQWAITVSGRRRAGTISKMLR